MPLIKKIRTFERIEPDFDAKRIIIFCEGRKTEYNYFAFFKNRDSRINVVVERPGKNENNTPSGLLNLAINKLELDNDIRAEDEIWLVFDTEIEENDKKRNEQIQELITGCSDRSWFFTESNPCFEVWLYFHYKESIAIKEELASFDNKWKPLLNSISDGGFNPKTDPELIKDAIRNAETAYSETENRPNQNCTQVYQLGKSLMKLLDEKFS